MDTTDLPTKQELKVMAHKMKQETGKQIGHCYEQIAKTYGFKTYASMIGFKKALNELA